MKVVNSQPDTIHINDLTEEMFIGAVINDKKCLLVENVSKSNSWAFREFPQIQSANHFGIPSNFRDKIKSYSNCCHQMVAFHTLSEFMKWATE